MQRVSQASVEVDGAVVGEIGRGLLVYLGVGVHDSVRDAEWMAGKIAHLRIFEDPEGRMNLSVLDLGGAALVISQFTLYADARKGRRPSYAAAAEPQAANTLYQATVDQLRSSLRRVETGMLQAEMRVSAVNEGPVNILLDSGGLF
ncbi:MAG TPA: D-aminoacyl-tRNA deacylase [Rectinemataceae bacterium]|nr:D-aminoacyl-tRNA deacylase [Rectinemataceae bacterium]